jgi:cell division protein FtsL
MKWPRFNFASGSENSSALSQLSNAKWLASDARTLRLNVWLLLALFATAMAVVHTQYESRRVFVKLEALQSEARQLRSEHDGLRAQQRELATSLRVDKTARERLGLQAATPANTQYVSAPAIERAVTPAADAKASSNATVKAKGANS